MSFGEEGISNYSTMLVRDDLGVLLLGAREAIYALDMSNISVRKSVVRTCEEPVQKEIIFDFIHSISIRFEDTPANDL